MSTVCNCHGLPAPDCPNVQGAMTKPIKAGARAEELDRITGHLTGAPSRLHISKTLDPLADWQKQVAYRFAEAYAAHENAELVRKRDELRRALDKYRTCIDAIYNESPAGRKLVIKHLGTLHPLAVLRASDSREEPVK